MCEFGASNKYGNAAATVAGPQIDLIEPNKSTELLPATIKKTGHC